MKKYTHAWLAFKAIERLENTTLSAENKKYADSLKQWFMANRDDVIKGSWYPDDIIKDMKTSHVLKFQPDVNGETEFKKLPSENLMYIAGKTTPLYQQGFVIEKHTNLPNRCEALAHSVIDNLKMQESENKGSSISTTDNHVATILFMLSHYVADAHVPFHCDSRSFSDGADIHGYVEGKWDEEIRKYYKIDEPNERFFYNPQGYPMLQPGNNNQTSFLKSVEDKLANRPFQLTYGGSGNNKNNNVGEYMYAICQYSYLLSYSFIPEQYDETNVTTSNFDSLPGQSPTLGKLSIMVLADAVDSIAKIWLRVWRRYQEWMEG